MSKHRYAGLAESEALVAIAALLILPHPAAAAAKQADASAVENIRQELLQLPYYGVFDFLAFSYEGDHATLLGYAYRPTLKGDAERAIRRASGVRRVDDRVEVLPVSLTDDDLR